MDGRALWLRARKGPRASFCHRLAKEIDEHLRMVVDGVENPSTLLRQGTLRARPATHCPFQQQKIEAQGAGGGRVGGKLSEMNLLDWMSSLEQGRKTCALILRNGADECTMFFEEGQVTHAVCGKLKGNPAVFKVLTWTEGDWELDFRMTATERTTTMPTQGLMMEGL
jgi:hypothetical protein